MTESTKTKVERKSRPAKGESRTERPTDRRYAAIGDFRDILTVTGGDNEQVYRWFQDSSESGQRIFDAYHAGWDLVDATKEGTLNIGQHYVDKTDKSGSVFRRPANRLGDFLYLMTMPKWAWEKIQAEKQREVDEVEEDILVPRHPDSDDGQYGQNKISSEFRQTKRREAID
jgi:hypothetical protein